MALGRSWRMFVPAIAVAVLAAGWSAYWYAVSSQAQKILARGEQEMAAKGMALACADRRWSGYPFRVEFHCLAPRFTAPVEGAEFSLAGGSIQLVMQAWNYKHVIGLIDGPTRAELPGLPPVDLQHKRAAASLRVTGDKTFVAGFELPEARVPGRFEAKSIVADARADAGGVAHLTAAADGVTFTLENGRYLPLKQVGIVLSGPAAVLMSPDPLAAAAETGAVLKVERFDFAGQGFNFAVHGDLHLDPEGLLNGKLIATTADIDKLLAALHPVLGVKLEDLSMVRAAIMLTNANRAGAVTVNISADKGAVKVGFFPVAQLKPFR